MTFKKIKIFITISIFFLSNSLLAEKMHGLAMHGLPLHNIQENYDILDFKISIQKNLGLFEF